MAKAQWFLAFALLGIPVAGCDDDSDGSEADRLGVGAECTADTDCTTEGTSCLTQFKGGYCGLENCKGDADCPQGSACVTHDDGANYCFLVCTDKVDCNVNRDVEDESNCVGNVLFVDNTTASKACVPPSGT
jgi:hypothetical protein